MICTMSRGAIFLVCLTMGWSAARAASETQSYEAVVNPIVRATMAEKHIPGLALVVVHDGKIILDKGYGVESVELGTPITGASVMPIASVSKIFAGTLAMQLVAEGRLDLDASIREWFPTVPADKAAITPRHLLSHTHGLTDFYRNKTFEALPASERDAMGADGRIAWSLHQPLEAAPGTAFSYSLVGYVMLQRIFEKVLGEPYGQIMQERLFTPLGIKSAQYGGSERLIPGRFPVMYEWKDGALAYHYIDFPPYVYTAGGLNISADDMAKYFIALDAGRLMPDAQRAEMWRAYPVQGAKQNVYGLGWFSYRRHKDGHFIVGHEGGGSTWVLHLPEDHLTIIAFSAMSGARADLLPHKLSYALLPMLKD